MAAGTSAASFLAVLIGLQISHQEVPWCPPVIATPHIMQKIAALLTEKCPSEQKRVDAIYGRLVREQGRLPYGYELWEAYDLATGQSPIGGGHLTPESYCA